VCDREDTLIMKSLISSLIGLFFASRLKKNAVVRTLESFTVSEGSPIKSDSMVVCERLVISLLTGR
jgi:hypothetical protein